MSETEANEFPLSAEIARDYRVLRRIGEGGMGDVYLAEQLRVGGRPVALKVLNRLYAKDPEMVERFRKEAAAAGRINHENIVKIYDSRVTGDGQLYIAMEYVDGPGLQELIAQRQPLPLPLVADIAGQICGALDAVHRRGVVHRDIKPDNIMLEPRGGGRYLARVLDFGIARLADRDTSRTAAGEILGAADYMSPEQAAGGTAEVDERADIYSLGMVLYEMLTGRVAFKAGTWTGVLYKQRHERPAPPSELRPDIPPALERVVLRALAKDPAERQQTAAELARELEEAVGQLPPRPDAKTRRTPPPASSPAKTMRSSTFRRFNVWVRDHIVVALLVGIVGSVIVAIPTYHVVEWWKEHRAPVPPPHVGLMEFRTALARPRADGYITVPPDNSVQSGEIIYLRVNPARAGSLYLMKENEDKSMDWLNPAEGMQPQLGRAGELLLVPPDFPYEFDERAGAERFLLIFVPVGVRWSMVDAALVGDLRASPRNTTTIGRAGASKILDYLANYGMQMKAITSPGPPEVVHRLLTPGEAQQVAYYWLELNHVPRDAR